MLFFLAEMVLGWNMAVLQILDDNWDHVPVWINFGRWHAATLYWADDYFGTVSSLLTEYNATFHKDRIAFDTEEDMVFFLLKWS